MSLSDELHALYEGTFRDIPADIREVMERGDRELAESGRAEQALNVGARAPRFALPSATGQRVALDDLLAQGPVVLTFYRGSWCPFCSLALRALQRQHISIVAKGARLVAVSPQTPDASLSLAERGRLAFDVLSDVGSDVAKQFGLAFDLSDELGALYDRLGFELERANGGYARTLPLPATYVIDRGGVIRWAFVDADYKVRAEPADVLAALDGLR